jgi:hypothetical protein
MANHKQIKTVLPDISVEEIRSLMKEGRFYRIVTKKIRRNRDTNETKSIEEEVSENMYRITLEDDFDEAFEYDDINGIKTEMRLKIVDET